VTKYESKSWPPTHTGHETEHFKTFSKQLRQLSKDFKTEKAYIINTQILCYKPL